MHRLKLFIPLIVFVLLALFFFVVQKDISRGDYDPQNMPSALINNPLPEFSLPDLVAGSSVNHADVVGRVLLVNVWATWCPTCHYEHPYLIDLAQSGVVILGVDYKDEPEKARQWLRDKGNPYRWVVDDREGRLGLDLGVTGAPETYVVDGKGIVRMRYQGAIDSKIWAAKLKPLVDQLLKEGV